MAGQSCPSNFKLPMEAEGSVSGLQRFLNGEIANGRLRDVWPPIKPLVVDGKCGPLTWAAWTRYIGGIAQEKGLPPPSTKPPVRVPPVVIAEPVYTSPSSPSTPIWQNPKFWIAAVAGVALLILLTKKRR